MRIAMLIRIPTLALVAMLGFCCLCWGQFDEFDPGNRLLRPQRWFLNINFDNDKNLITEMAKLKAIVIAQQKNEKWLIFQELPGKKHDELDERGTQDFMQAKQRILYTSRNVDTCAAFAKAMELDQPPKSLFLLIPQDLEKLLIKAELKHAELSETEVEKKKLRTKFAITKKDDTWDVQVISQFTKDSIEEWLEKVKLDDPIRLERPQRWILSINFDEPGDLILGMKDLGAIVIAEQQDASDFILFEELKKDKAKAINPDKTVEFFNKQQRIWYTSKSNGVCTAFAEAMGSEKKYSVIVLTVPKEFEKLLLDAELKHANATEKTIQEKKLKTRFKVTKTDKSWEVRVLEQGPDLK